MQTDGGWAWAVLAGSMGCNFLNGVLCYFVGVMHTGLLHKYQASVTTTAWVGALYAANMSLTAPIAATVINRVGCRISCIAGGLLCFVGFLASAFAPSISWLFVTYGLLAGLGLGLTYAPSVITIGFYFDRLRGVASGLSVGFAAIGILSGSLITQTLIDQYSVSGAFIIIAAVSLHFCFFGGFFRPSEQEMGNKVSVDGDLDRGILDNKASMLSLALHGIEIRTVSQHSIHKNPDPLGRLGYGSVTSLLRKIQTARLRQTLENGSLAASMYSGGGEDMHSAMYRPDKGSSSIVVPGSEIVQVECEEVTNLEELEKMPLSGRPESPNNIHADGQTLGGGVVLSTTPVQTLPGIVLEHIGEDFDQVQHRSVSDAAEARSSDYGHTNDRASVDEDGAGSHRLALTHATPHSPYSEDVHSVTSRDEAKGRPWKARRTPTLTTKLLKAADSYVAVLTHKAFMFHCASTLAANIHISGIYLHLPEYVLTKGTSSNQAAALFIAVGLSSLLSRLASGFATMDAKIESLTLNMGMMGLCGVSTIFFPLFADTYTGQLVFSALFGLYTGGLYALISVLSVYFMGISLLPTALGVLAFMMGVGYVSGPPLAALIVDSGGTYQHSFIFLGIMMIVAAFLDMAAVAFIEPKEEAGSGEKGEEYMMEVASISRDWLGSSIVISCQDTASAHVQHELGSVMSVRSRFSHEVNT
ncbi:hypothetical protein ACOMHN_018324 [Nucella lapillus]